MANPEQTTPGTPGNQGDAHGEANHVPDQAELQSADEMADEALRRVEDAANRLQAEHGQQTVEPNLPDFGPASVRTAADSPDLTMLHDVDLNVTIELGRTRMFVEDVVQLGADSVIELDKAAGDPVDVFVNGRKVARGEVLVLNDNFCIRVSEILSAEPTLGNATGGVLPANHVDADREETRAN